MITFNLNSICDGEFRIVFVSDPNNSNISNDSFIVEIYSGSTATGSPLDSDSPIFAAPGPQYGFTGLAPNQTYTVKLISQGDGTSTTNTINVGACCDLSSSTTTITVTDSTFCFSPDGQISVSSSSSGIEARVFRFDISAYTSWETLPHTFTNLTTGSYRVEFRSSDESCNYDETVYVGPDCCINTPTINVFDSANGSSTGYIKYTHTQTGYEYGVTAAGGVIGDVTTWTTNKYITGLSAGNYLLWVKKVLDNSCNSSFAFTVNDDLCSDYTLSVSVVNVSDETGPNLNNGSVELNGNNNYPQLDGLGNTFYPTTFALSGQMTKGPQSNYIFEDLEPGDYTATISNAAGCTSTVDFTILSGDITLFPVAYVPKLNSIHFVNQVIPDYKNSFNKNVLNQNQYHEGFVKPFCYQQLFVKSETLKIQLRTNYEYNYLRVKDTNGNIQGSIVSSDLKVTNINITDTKSVSISDAGSGQAYVMFDSGDLPSWAKVNHVITLSGTTYTDTLTGITYDIDGNYSIVEVSNIGYDGLPYVLINASLNNAGTISGTLTTIYNALDYNIHEFTFSIDIEGVYFLEIYGTDPDYSDYLWTSDYVRITDNQEILKNHVKIAWHHDENDFGMDYSTGITPFSRIYGNFHTPVPAGEDDMIRDAEDDWIKIQSYKRTRRLLKVKQVPNYLIEKLNFALGHDNIYLNEYTVQTDSNLSVEPLGKSQYFNAEVEIEILNYL